MLQRSGRSPAALLIVVLAVLLAACGAPGSSGEGSGADGATAPLRVGLVHSTTGPLASYGAQYAAGFRAGLDYATGGTGKVGERSVEITEADDAGDPAKAVAAATDLIGQGYKVIAGSTASGVALQVAPLAEENRVLFISGPAATDAVTGANAYTFRSGRQTYQDVLTAGTIVGDPAGRSVIVFAQDSAFGQANAQAVTTVLGGKGARVTPVLVPAGATDLTPFARQAVDAAPDLLFVAWAGANATQMWQTLQQQGAFEASTVVTGLDIKATYPIFGPAADKIHFLSHFFPGATSNEAYKALEAGLAKQGAEVDLFTNDGFVAAQMVVHALEEGSDDTAAMAKALEGWTFTGPKGETTIRAEDHAVLQPMFTARLTPSGGGFAPQLVDTLSPDAVAPPVAPVK
ncbi:substrate-binding domain-containing protein [Pseudonocardia xinjiangensis]|uniref:substrate-binding domain-containing protein n=1 Tax=Pseudonocardia xinjiangensis TaxID=75289 RepID=UPI003D9401E2